MSTFFQTSFAIPASSADTPASPLCPGDLPLLLLPVRLETRFFTLADRTTELRVRVFPDKIHCDSHEPDLTPDELTWGQHYWQHDWRAGDHTDARADAWRQLADRFGARRAAWIVRVLTPTNVSQRPTTRTPEGSAPTVPIEFPPVVAAQSNETWRHAPQARLLPDRWVAMVHSAGRVVVSVTGKDIHRPLAVGPNPLAAAPDQETEAAIARGDQLAIDAGMKWMTDFDEAERVGMALRIPIAAATITAGLESLVVFGVVRSLTVAQTATQLADLLDAHHYTDGLAFVRPGTATNNTEDRRAGYSTDDPGHARSFDLEIKSTPVLEDNNVQHLGNALGLPFDRILPTLGRVERGAARDDRSMRAMNTALWQVGWGYFLSNMIGTEAGLTRADLEWARRHFLDCVRSFGPFPALRCGAQPYGVLPVTSLDLWQPGEGAPSQEAFLKGMLTSLRDGVWRPAAGSVARIGNRQNPPDPDADLNDVMQTDAVSHAYRTRHVFGTHFLQHLYHLLASSMPATDPAQTALLQQLGVAWRPRLSRLRNADWRRNVMAPLVQRGEVSPWAKLEPNYISALLGERRIEQLILARPEPTDITYTTSLLQTLLRHALLREIAYAAARLQSDETGADLTALLRDAELIDLVASATPTMHWRRQLEQTLTSTGGRTIREFLEAETNFTAPALVALGEFRASLTHLQDLDSEGLSHLMQGSIDLSAHRLDAWVTSLATKRLTAMHTDGPAGQYIGAYGWVENLRPMPASMVKPVPTLPAGEPGPLQTAANDSGFIHAPSLAHAAAAALLRNSHLGPTGVPKPDGPFAIELSSRRVREAARLLDGVRQGQPLGALLGYRVERLLHDTTVDNGRSLDRFIAPLRRVAPLVARTSAIPTGPVDTIAANNVVDGLVLNRRWNEERSVVLAELNKAVMGTSDLATLTSIMNALADAIDGLSDALTAESVYQMVRGNTSRTASTLAAIAQGDAPPPELEVTRTPRTGTSMTHRVLLLMSGPNVNTPGWVGADAAVRSAAEKMLNFWAFKLLGDGGKIRCSVERLDDTTGAVVETRAFPLSELGIAPLDVVYGVEATNATAQTDVASSEIEQRVLYHAKHKPGGFEPIATLRLQHARPADLAAGEVTLFDALEQARNIRRLLQVARGADPEDLNPPERTAQGTIDLADLEARVVKAETALNAAHTALTNLIARIATTTTAEMLRGALLKIGGFGVAPAAPVSAAGEGAEAVAALARQGKALLKISGSRLEQGQVLRTQAAAEDPRERRQQWVARMRAVFGTGFAVLPRFTFDSAAATEFASALTASTAAQGGDAMAAHTWFARCARVREGVAQFGGCMQRAEVLGTGARLTLSVAQLPFVSGERWVGLPPPPGSTLPPSKLSLVLGTIGPVNATQVMTGLLVDEWVEIVPSADETTALAFQFDMPDACAPQSVLIAVPPVPGQEWTTETLRRVLMETLDLAKLRAVDTEALGAASQHLPGLYLALNTEDHAVSTDFAPLTTT